MLPVTCAFVRCEDAEACGLVGGCTQRRFQAVACVDDRPRRSLAGVRPARANRDPSTIKRRRRMIIK